MIEKIGRVRVGGPLGGSSLAPPHRHTRAFVQSCHEIGMPHYHDFNGTRREGASSNQTTTRNARRFSAAVGYLKPALGRDNLKVVAEALASRIDVDAEGVVDPMLLVRGGEGLRICDSSIMPRLVNSSTNAPSIKIGEKACVMILGNA